MDHDESRREPTGEEQHLLKVETGRAEVFAKGLTTKILENQSSPCSFPNVGESPDDPIIVEALVKQVLVTEAGNKTKRGMLAAQRLDDNRKLVRQPEAAENLCAGTLEQNVGCPVSGKNNSQSTGP